MDFDKIVREWFYRLPKGYADAPYSQQELAILDEVMTENGVSLPEAKLEKEKFTEPEQMRNEVDQLDQAFLDAKPVEEATRGLDDFEIKPELIDALTAKGNLNDFNEFLSLLPGGESKDAVQEFFNTITPTEIKEFVEILYSETSIDALKDLKFDKGIASRLVKLKPAGLGRGEIYLAVLIKGAVVSGGGESYDLTIPESAADKEGPFARKTKYEVKDYRVSKSDSIRLGVKGTITKQNWWRGEILPTLDLMKKLESSEAGRAWLNQPDNKEVKVFADYLNSKGPRQKEDDNRVRYDFIPTGEFNKGDLEAFTDGYKALNKVAVSDSKSYDVMTLRGPNQKPIALAVDIPSTDVAANIESLNVKVLGVAGIEQIITELRRLEFVRDPEKLAETLQDSVNKIVGDEIPFILFRPKEIKVLSDFKFASVSQGGVKIIEQD